MPVQRVYYHRAIACEAEIFGAALAREDFTDIQNKQIIESKQSIVNKGQL